MKDYGIVYSSNTPQEIEITPNSVFVTSDVTSYSETIDGHLIEGYKYHYIEYTKDEYLALTMTRISNLEEELAAAKILLGVE